MSEETNQKPIRKLFTDKRPFRIVTYLFPVAADAVRPRLIAETYRVDEKHGGYLKPNDPPGVDRLLTERGGAEVEVKGWATRETFFQVCECEEWKEPEPFKLGS